MESTGNNKLVVRQAEEPEVELYLEWEAREGWVVRPEITRGFYKEFPHGWFICELMPKNNETSSENTSNSIDGTFELKRNKIIGLLHCIKYRSNVGYIGFFVMDPEYRGQGFGQKMFQYVLDNYLFNENEGGPATKSVGLSATKDAVPFYLRHGFNPVDETVRYKGIVNRDLLETIEQVDGILRTQINESDLEEVALLDEKYSLAYRPGFWRNWMDEERKSSGRSDECYKSVLYRDASGNLLGMGMLGGITRQGCYMLRLGPIYAENFEVFKTIVVKLLLMTGNLRDTPVFVDLLCGNKDACELYQNTLGLEKALTTIYMWKGDLLSFDAEKVKRTYALASLDFP